MTGCATDNNDTHERINTSGGGPTHNPNIGNATGSGGTASGVGTGGGTAGQGAATGTGTAP